ncbi:MAG: YceI family protein [Pseudomonadota bacterium]
MAVRFGLASAPVLICALLAATASARAAEIDPQHTRIGFTLKTRWGQVLHGRFPRYEGRIETLDDGRRRVRLTMSARDVEIVGHPNYTDMTRGRGFFEADRFPVVEFVSEPYPPALIADGGKLAGELSIRNVRRRETFAIEPSDCERPAYACDVVAGGSVRRTDYGVDRWIFAVSDHVRFTLRLRLREEGE